MINNQYFCPSILAITPFSTVLVSRDIQGEVGLSGPNVELISFNSGDTPITSNFTYAVGLGLARIITAGNNSIALSQLGVVVNNAGILSNFEIAYSGNTNTLNFIVTYVLVVIRSTNDNGNDYTIPNGESIFTGSLVSMNNGQLSKNRLITTPIPLSNVNVSKGDRVVLRVQVSFVTPNIQIGVSASVQLTPSDI